MQSSSAIQSDYREAIDNMSKDLSDIKLRLQDILPIAPMQSLNTPQSSAPSSSYELFHELILSHLENITIAANKIDPSDIGTHYAYARNHLHPWVLDSPFVFRAFTKPLGYAGDFEVVNLLLSDPWQGNTAYARVVNAAFVGTTVAQAHRNRIDMLSQLLVKTAGQAMRCGRTFNILNIGCGPAAEIVRFIETSREPHWLSIKLVDASDEALHYATEKIDACCDINHRHIDIKAEQSTIQDLIKHATASSDSNNRKFDLIYCAGLFDYLSDLLCRRITKNLAHMLNDGGSLVFTNVHAKNPNRVIMEHLLDWHLIYRDEEAMQAICPEGLTPDRPYTDATGTNVFLHAYN
jgi:extracellular factor (EF) 3-hydroxypalmitic acid methyl ester biosynthesis protein